MSPQPNHLPVPIRVLMHPDGDSYAFCSGRCQRGWRMSDAQRALRVVPSQHPTEGNFCIHCAGCGAIVNEPFAPCCLHGDDCPEVTVPAEALRVALIIGRPRADRVDAAWDAMESTVEAGRDWGKSPTVAELVDVVGGTSA